MTELIPCPFCNDKHIRFCRTMDLDGNISYQGLCLHCGATAGHPRLTKETAITAWNTRTDDKHLTQLRNLLAIIHRDGGHYVAEHGLEKATEDAIKKVLAWMPSQGD